MLNLEKYDNKQKAMAAVGMLCAVGLCYGLFVRFSPKPVEEKIIPVVRTITVGAKEGISSAEYPGEVKGRYESNLAFQVAGKINSRLVNIGDKVSKGQVLMQLDTKDVAQGAIASNAALEAAQANYKLAQDNFNRFNELRKQGAISQMVYDNYKTQLAAAEATLRQAQAQASVSGNQLDYATLKSDANGVVARVLAEVGQVTGAGTPVVTVVQDGEREVQINVPENILKNLKLGDEAKITFWALNKSEAKGFVREISPIADTLTKTFKINITIPDVPKDVQLGMTAKVSFANTNSSQALTIPASSIYQVNKQPAVWIVNQDNKVELKDVEIANYAGNDVVISSGVKPGDKVVIAGLAKLTKGQAVRLEKSGEK